MAVQELGDGTGVPGQEFSVGASGKAVLNLADYLTRGEPFLPRGGGTSEADKSSDLGQLQVQLAVQKKMSNHPAAGVVLASLSEKRKGCLQDGMSLGRTHSLRNLSPI